MKRSGLVVVFGLISTMATLGVLGYARDGVDHGEPMVFAVVSKVDVPAGTDLNQLIKDDQLRIIMIPLDVVVDGAITSIDQLKDRCNTVAIHAGEPILAGRLKIVAERCRSALVSKAMTIGA